MTVVKWAKREVKTKALYVTKYALASGIELHDMRETDDPKRFYHPSNFNSFVLGRDCFESLEDAKANVDKRKADKLKSLTKQMERLSSFKVSVKDKRKGEAND